MLTEAQQQYSNPKWLMNAGTLLAELKALVVVKELE